MASGMLTGSGFAPPLPAHMILSSLLPSTTREETLDMQRRVVFFGASVTEQDTHHATGALSGYVTYFQRNLSEGWSVERVSAGSSTIADAGVVYVERVIALAPDICVLDWATPALTDCDPRLVTQVYYRLLQHGILPVTVIFPRRDRDQRQIPIVRHMEALCRDFDLPFFDASSLIEDFGVDEVLRDTVHTTPKGARIYAEAMAELLSGLKTTAPPAFDRPAPYRVVELTTTKDVPLSFTRMTVTNKGPEDEPLELSIVMEQRVGPYSPVLDTMIRAGRETRSLTPYPVWDAWCWRERQCIKAITDWYKGALSTLVLTVSAVPPPYASIPQAEPVELSDRHLKQRGKVYAILTASSSAELSYHCDNPKLADPIPTTVPAVEGTQSANTALPATNPAHATDCVLHLGIGTGFSATLHRSLQSARNRLQEAGVLYPEDILPGGQTGGDNHKCLAIAATNPDAGNIVLRQHQALTPALRASFDSRVREHYRKIAKDAAGKPCLLSAEHFWSCLTRPEEISRLARITADAGLKISRLVIYLQRQADWLEALQFQRLREGRDLLPMKAQQLVTPHFRTQLDYSTVIEAWQAGFPGAVIIPRLYQGELTESSNQARLTDFVRATGLPLGNIPVQDAPGGPLLLSNAGINALLTLAKDFPALLPNGRSNPARIDLIAGISKALPGRCSLLPHAEKEAIDALFAETNENLRKLYFPDQPNLFPADPAGEETETFNRIEDTRFVSALTTLLQTIEPSLASL